MEDGTVAGDQQCQRLRTRIELWMGSIEVILKGNVFGKEVIDSHIHRGRVQRATICASAAIVDHHSFARIGVRAAQPDVRLVDGEHFAVDSWNHQHQRSCLWSRIERALN